MIKPVAGAYNAYAQAVAYAEVLSSGLRRRMRNRMCDRNGVKTTLLEVVAAWSEMEAETSRCNCNCSPLMPRREKRGSSLDGGGEKEAF